jgi:hypothetical protein
MQIETQLATTQIVKDLTTKNQKDPIVSRARRRHGKVTRRQIARSPSPFSISKTPTSLLTSIMHTP